MTLDAEMVAQLAEALEGVSQSGDASLAPALPALARLGAAGHRLRIDWRATDRLGAPVILAVPAAPELPTLSPRQRQVAAALAAGRANKEIARDLGISLATVKDHVHAVLSRLGLQRRAQVAGHLASLGSAAGSDYPSKDGDRG